MRRAPSDVASADRSGCCRWSQAAGGSVRGPSARELGGRALRLRRLLAPFTGGRRRPGAPRGAARCGSRAFRRVRHATQGQCRPRAGPGAFLTLRMRGGGYLRELFREATHPGVNPCMQAAMETGMRAAMQILQRTVPAAKL
eukprot:scaffold1578_cov340-Prasinococcus_capsulatus_cf.AAC.3